MLITFLVFIGFSVLHFMSFHFRFSVHIIEPVFVSHDGLANHHMTVTPRTYTFFVREQLGTTVPWCNSRPFLFLSQLQQELRILLVYRLCEFWLFLTDIGMAKWGEGDPRWIVEERADAKNVNNWHW